LNLEKAAKAEIGTKIEAVSGVLAFKSFFSRTALSRLSGTPPKVAKEVLSEGLQTVKRGQTIRDRAIKQAQKTGGKVNGTQVFNVVQQWADDAIALAKPSQKKQINEFLTTARRRFLGKTLNPTTAKRRWDTAKKGFTSAGDAGKTIEAGFNMAVRDGIRGELDTVTGGAFEEGTKLISEGIDEKKLLSSIAKSLKRKETVQLIEGTPSAAGEFLKKTGGRVAAGAAGGLGLAAVASALGVRLPGAAE
jgi:hypothetical protein